jgi:hypothetical protein
MGMFDNVVLLDEPLTCPAGHSVGGLQTKSFSEPSMSTYLIAKGRVVRAARSARRHDNDDDERSAWRISGDEIIHETLYRLEPVSPPAEVSVYSHCARCEPVLVRTDRASFWGDIVHEHRLFVEFSLHFSEGEPMRVERVTGDRSALMDELRGTGLRVLADNDPLAVAHHEIQRAKREPRRRS